jgi:hypothetical protein
MGELTIIIINKIKKRSKKGLNNLFEIIEGDG